MTKSEELIEVGTQINMLYKKLQQLSKECLKEYAQKYGEVYKSNFISVPIDNCEDFTIENNILYWEYWQFGETQYRSIDITRFNLTLEELKEEKRANEENYEKQQKELIAKHKKEQNERDYKLYLELKEKFEKRFSC